MLTFQQIIHKLTEFWEQEGCIIHLGHDLEMGAGTFNPATFLRCLGPEPYKTAYVEPSRRPSDGRYGLNPNRLQLFHQFQVIIKPSPPEILDLYKKSLEVIGLNLSEHDFRLVHDDWESPTLGAHGLGWEVWIDGMEVTQFTYFQAVANLPLHPVSVEITYGLERLCMYVQNKDNFFDMQWNESYTFRDIIQQNEVEWSAYNFSQASTEMWFRHFDDYEREANALMDANLPLPAYDFVIKASHAFNLLDARGVISVTERAGYIGRIRGLARRIATSYLEMRESLHFPLMDKLPKEEEVKPVLSVLPTVFSAEKRDTFLLEIGSEELPATFVPSGMRSLEKAMTHILKEHTIVFESVEVFGAPRRLGVLVHGLAEGSSDTSVGRKGPAIASAFDKTGNPTPQGAGFLKAIGQEDATLAAIQKGHVSGLEMRELKGQSYLFAHIEKKGTSIYSLLAENLPSLILGLDFPKKMRWGTLDVSYPRPIHWIVALYGGQVIPFVVGDVASNNYSFGHGQLCNEKVVLSSASNYYSELEERSVLANVQRRKESIEKQIRVIEQEYRGQALEKEKVMRQVLYLSEWPMLTIADFDESFLKAPPEVLISEMVEHQKYFPFGDKDGRLQNLFIITADNTPNDLIRRGNQKVLSARLADGVFLYEQDQKEPLEKFNEKLAKMTFQKELGSVLDKVDRISNLSATLNDILQLTDAKRLGRAAQLCKSDLASDMVGEFPDLQGTIGKYYATAQGEDPEVATAIEEHWMPTKEGGPLPQSPSGILLCLADKLDNLISYFSVGLKPTSSSDPYALRRQTIGLIKVLINHKLSLDLSSLLDDEVLAYVTSRSKGVYEELGFQKDEIEASLSGMCKDPFDQICKVEALHAFRKSDTFALLYEVYKRAKGQLQKGEASLFDPSLATEPSEQALLIALESVEDSLPKLLQERSYEKAFTLLATLQKPLGDLFDSVKILADDPKVQGNRLGLLERVFAHFEVLLDFSMIQEK